MTRQGTRILIFLLPLMENKRTLTYTNSAIILQCKTDNRPDRQKEIDLHATDQRVPQVKSWQPN